MSRDISRHQCPVTGCRKLLPWHKLMCLDDWRRCPQALRDAVMTAWDNGAGVGTPALMHAQYAAIEAVEAKLAAKAATR